MCRGGRLAGCWPDLDLADDPDAAPLLLEGAARALQRTVGTPRAPFGGSEVLV